ncbi:MAG TPA: hypothetical protein DD490_03350 [Acidobacteria bacterium]|nr:hypothetical protein [Acidobacteriota bacterium]
MTAQVLQIVPELPPRLGGVGGYALALARALRDHAGMETHFLVTDPAWRPAETGETGVTGERLPARSVRALRGALTAAGREGLPVLLHYANYAYQRRGCPFWLVRTLEIRPSHRLVTFFHEVHAGGPPWRSSFWLAPLQRHLAARLARRSDRCATSLPLYRGLLEALAPGTDAVVLPVLSPLGEPAEVAPLAARHPRRLLVFGGPGARRRAYGERRGDLAAACAALEITEILDIGAPLDPAPPAAIAGVPVHLCGPLPDAAASRLFAEAFAGFLAYPPAFLGKSTIFAACSSHGALPVSSWEGTEARPAPGLLWSPGDPAGAADVQAVASAARAWYLDHAAPTAAAAFHQLLLPGPAAVAS